MNFLSLDLTLLAVAVLIVLSVLASRASGRLGVPALVVFLAVGMLAGSEGPGGIPFDDPLLAQWIGTIALAYILFAGGLDTHWSLVRPVAPQALILATVGVVLTASLVGWFAHLVLDITLLEGFLLGSIVSSTDAAAVFAVLRARGVHIAPRLRGMLELESGSNDPMAVFLTVSAIAMLQQPGGSPWRFFFEFVQQMTLGCAVGAALGWLAVKVINRIDLDYDGLYTVLTLGWVLLTYAAAAVVGGNGFLAVYVAGLLMGARRFLHKRKLIRFHDGVAWLMQVTMFLALGLLVFPSRLPAVAGWSLLIALFLMFVARPVAVFATMLGRSFNVREKAFIGWVGLRGAVPIVLATFPINAGVQQSGTLFNIVFFIVLTSVLLQGTTLPNVARLLKLDFGLSEIDPALPLRRESELVTLVVAPDSVAAGDRIVHLPFPPDSLVLLVHREGGFFVPDGRTVIEPGDKLVVFTSKESIGGVRQMMEARA
jgi:cell volume regulation protein A